MMMHLLFRMEETSVKDLPSSLYFSTKNLIKENLNPLSSITCLSSVRTSVDNVSQSLFKLPCLLVFAGRPTTERLLFENAIQFP